MLDLEILPEKSISSEKWQIMLGMSIYQVIQILKSNCEIIKTVQMIYNDEDPLRSDYMINLVNDGIILYFDSHNQRLKLIEICDLKKLKLRYYGNYFNNLPAVQPTFEQIVEIFGLTSPGTGRAPLASKISIYHGNSPNNAVAPEMPSICLGKDIYGSKLRVIREGKVTKGIHLSVFIQGSYQLDREVFDTEIMFNDTCQDVASVVGAPNGVNYKSEELFKLGISENLQSIGNISQYNDYFYNYITLGLDVLFNSENHRVSKFVLHTNFPCHFNFNSYFMCNFEIPITVPETNQIFVVTPSTKLEKLRETLNIKTQPAILHRSSSTNSVNPFGPTFFYIYEDIIFEIMTNGYIASVILFKS